MSKLKEMVELLKGAITDEKSYRADGKLLNDYGKGMVDTMKKCLGHAERLLAEEQAQMREGQECASCELADKLDPANKLTGKHLGQRQIPTEGHLEGVVYGRVAPQSLVEWCKGKLKTLDHAITRDQQAEIIGYNNAMRECAIELSRHAQEPIEADKGLTIRKIKSKIPYGLRTNPKI